MNKFILTLVLLLMISCGGQEVINKDQVIVALSASPVTKDAHKMTENISRAVNVHLYDSLIHIDTNGSYIPGLATSWEYLSPTRLQLSLREGVVFHNGEPLTADDVIASLDRVRTTPESQTLYDKIDSISKIDDFTIVVNMTDPFPSMVGYLAHPKAAIYPKSLIDEIGMDTVETPIGTGPYMYEEWIHGDRITFKANPNYWDGAPSIETLIFKVVLDEGVRAISIETGDVQVVMDVGASNEDILKDKPNINLIYFDNIGVDYLGFNMQSPALSNQKLRQAIMMAIDKQAIIDTILFGLGKPSETLFDQRMFGALTDPDPLQYNPEAAKKIIEEEGLTGTKLTILGNEGHRSKMAEIIQSYLKEIGIELEIQILEWGTYLETLGQGKHQLYLLGWSNSAFDPDSSLYTVFHTDNINSGYNNNRYSNPEVDRLIELASVELDSNTRANYYQEAQRIIRADNATMFLYSRTYLLAFTEGLTGAMIIPTGDHKLHKLRYE